jgi:hypothetical protein
MRMGCGPPPNGDSLRRKIVREAAMAGPGFWSITVEVTNNAGRNLILDPAETVPPVSWVGPPPAWGATLAPGASQTFQAAVPTPPDGVSLVLGFATGDGPAAEITAAVGPGVEPGCTVRPGEGVQGVVAQVGTDPQHPVFTVQLTA